MSPTQVPTTLPGVTHSTLTADVPRLVPLLDEHPSLAVYTRSSPHFETYRQLANHRATTQPLAIIRPQTEAQVQAALSLCAAEAIPLAIRGGGHDFQGRSLVADGVVVDMRCFASVHISADRKTARIGGGTLGRDLLAALEAKKLTAPTAWSNTVGYAGWATGGGYGAMQGKYGLGVDQIVGARVITPNKGAVDTDDDAELLWALRGAGTGAFGAIVELRIKVYPQPNMLAGTLAFSLDDGGDKVLTGFADMCAADLPDAFSGEFMVARKAGGPAAVVVMFSWVQEHDDLSAARAYLHKVSRLGTVLVNTVIETTPRAFAVALEPLFGHSSLIHCTTRTVETVTPQLVRILVGSGSPLETCVVVAHSAHGASVAPSLSTSFALRSRHIVLGIGSGEQPNSSNSASAEAPRWVDSVARAISENGLALPSKYLSFSPPDECDNLANFGAEGVERLMAVKTRYDGGNVLSAAYPRLM